MGCIEMIREIRMISHLGLIETWDVLKWVSNIYGLHEAGWLIETWDVLKSVQTGMNEWEGRLIETWDVLKLSKMLCSINSFWINRNMGCIEISWICLSGISVCRLIETWDVLKYFSLVYIEQQRHWLIETWDVLKCCKCMPRKSALAD